MATITMYPGVIVANNFAANQDVISAGTPVRITKVRYGGGPSGIASITDAGGSVNKWESLPDLFVEETDFDPPLVLNGLRISQNTSGGSVGSGTAVPLYIYTA